MYRLDEKARQIRTANTDDWLQYWNEDSYGRPISPKHEDHCRDALPSQMKKTERNWRTRPDPFSDVWESDVAPLLRSDPEGELPATTILEWLDEQHPGRFGRSQLRTLQRRIHDHRALHGPDREVYFEQ